MHPGGDKHRNIDYSGGEHKAPRRRRITTNCDDEAERAAPGCEWLRRTGPKASNNSTNDNSNEGQPLSSPWSDAEQNSGDGPDDRALRGARAQMTRHQRGAAQAATPPPARSGTGRSGRTAMRTNISGGNRDETAKQNDSGKSNRSQILIGWTLGAPRVALDLIGWIWVHPGPHKHLAVWTLERPPGAAPSSGEGKRRAANELPPTATTRQREQRPAASGADGPGPRPTTTAPTTTATASSAWLPAAPSSGQKQRPHARVVDTYRSHADAAVAVASASAEAGRGVTAEAEPH